jgi:hypothetical protein
MYISKYNKRFCDYLLFFKLMIYELYLIKCNPYNIYGNQFYFSIVLFLGYCGYSSQSRDETLSIVRLYVTLPVTPGIYTLHLQYCCLSLLKSDDLYIGNSVSSNKACLSSLLRREYRVIWRPTFRQTTVAEGYCDTDI